MFTAIDHVGIAVESLKRAVAFYEQTMSVVYQERIEEQGVDAVLLDIGDSHIELLAPLHEDTPVGRFMTRSGPGLHHVAYRVEDIKIALNYCRELNWQLIDQTPRRGIRDSLVAFVHPKTTGGVLTEIVQPAKDSK